MPPKCFLGLHSEWKHIGIVLADIKYLLYLLASEVGWKYLISCHGPAGNNDKQPMMPELIKHFIIGQLLIISSLEEFLIFIFLATILWLDRFAKKLYLIYSLILYFVYFPPQYLYNFPAATSFLISLYA